VWLPSGPPTRVKRARDRNSERDLLMLLAEVAEIILQAPKSESDPPLSGSLNSPRQDTVPGGVVAGQSASGHSTRASETATFAEGVTTSRKSGAGQSPVKRRKGVRTGNIAWVLWVLPAD
jgi:hypothetical protein